jgi:exodeoxyribonuclease VII large subunit
MTVLTVTQVNTYIKALLDEIPQVKNVYIAGEISNFKHYYQSGHMYFTLKDAKSQLKCVMFSSDNYKLKFTPENGMSIICFGQIGVYERDGVYQLYVRDMQPKGAGELAVAYEQLKNKLSQEGLFDDSHKKPIPAYPSKIGVATSNMGAAVEDIKNVISRRFPLCEIIIVPTVVQGDSASDDIVKSIKLLDNMNVDTIIVGRGGGSIEDLWAFNTEPVARAVFNCKTPIISAVGHETDYTICDFVADLRAPTPSAAAELAVPDVASELINVNNISASLEMLINHKLEIEEARVENIKDNSVIANFDSIFDNMYNKINNYTNQIFNICDTIIERKQNELSNNVGMLNALSPLAVLSRGFSITSKNNEILSSVNQIKVDDTINIRFKDGTANAVVKEIENNG